MSNRKFGCNKTYHLKGEMFTILSEFVKNTASNPILMISDQIVMTPKSTLAFLLLLSCLTLGSTLKTGTFVRTQVMPMLTVLLILMKTL